MLRMCPDYMLGLMHGEVLAGTLRGAPLLVYKDGQVSLVRNADEIPDSFEVVTRPWREKVGFEGTPYLGMVDVTLAREYRGSMVEGKPLIDEFIQRAIEELFGHEHAFTMTPRIVRESLRDMHRRNGAEGPVRIIKNFRPGYSDPDVDVMHYPLGQ
ncbi:MAG: hypothetical protein HYT72_05125 [Candidatus Aenigmarchaeota archaeon]|nr:hypothetical protein [Candidatus Aenigmarchaeota archaeon]